jgi:DNA polymerase-1
VVNAAYGVTSVVLKMLKMEEPDAFIACWDTEAATFRHKAYKEYKAQRQEQPDELYDQVPITKEVLKTLGVPSVELDGYEADDLLGTFAARGVKDGYHVRIVTGDRDAFQLINPHVDVLTFKKGMSDTRLITAKEVKEDYGITPDQLIYWKALRGDTSDNIPGVRGIGEKGATELVQEHGTLEKIFKAAHDPRSTMKESIRKKLLEGEEGGRTALTLVGIDCDVPVTFDFKKAKAVPNREAFVQAAATYGFRSLIARFPGAGSVDAEEEMPPARKPAGTKKKKASDESAPISTEPEALAFLAEVQDAKDVTVSLVVGAQESLFGGGGVEALVFGLTKKVGIIPAALLAKSSVRKEVAAILSSPHVGKICHDAKRVMKELESLDLPLEGIAHDTLIAAYLLAAGERSLDLETLALQETKQPLPTDASRPVFEARAIRSIADTQKTEMAKTHADHVWERFERPLIPVLRNMERVGVLADIPYLKTLSKELQADKAALEKKMEKLVGHPFNPASPSQLAVILFDELGLSAKGIKRGKTGYSTAASELEKLEGTHEIIALIGEHRELAKMLSTYVETLPTLADTAGRVHTTFNQAVAATGRLSSSDPNMQNIPIRTELGRRIRHAFIAEKGMTLLSCDYSQIELRVVAAMSGDKKMLAAFHAGEDIHAATASAIWDVPLTEVTQDQRRKAKAINFGILYGQGPHGLARVTGLSYAEAKDFIAAYYKAHHSVRDFLDATKAKAQELGYVETLFGRRRSTPDIHSNIPYLRAAAERMAINMPVQGTATGDLIKLALIALAKDLPKISADTRMLLQVHDEVLFEVPTKEVKRVAAAVKDIMENVEKIGCPIVVEAKAGKNWEEMEKVA